MEGELPPRRRTGSPATHAISAALPLKWQLGAPFFPTIFKIVLPRRARGAGEGEHGEEERRRGRVGRDGPGHPMGGSRFPLGRSRSSPGRIAILRCKDRDHPLEDGDHPSDGSTSTPDDHAPCQGGPPACRGGARPSPRRITVMPGKTPIIHGEERGPARECRGDADGPAVRSRRGTGSSPGRARCCGLRMPVHRAPCATTRNDSPSPRPRDQAPTQTRVVGRQGRWR